MVFNSIGHIVKLIKDIFNFILDFYISHFCDHYDE